MNFEELVEKNSVLFAGWEVEDTLEHFVFKRKCAKCSGEFSLHAGKRGDDDLQKIINNDENLKSYLLNERNCSNCRG